MCRGPAVSQRYNPASGGALVIVAASGSCVTLLMNGLTGSEDAVLWGRWSLQPLSSGTVRDVTLALDCRAPTLSTSAV
jgi:hypothetical protein